MESIYKKIIEAPVGYSVYNFWIDVESYLRELR
jgi:hypothetical protein